MSENHREAPPVRARRVISENRFLSYVEEDLRDRHGRSYTYYQVESKFDAVVVVPVLPDGRLLLERIYRHPYRRWFLEFPAGGIEPGEEPIAAGVRELAEETGHHATRMVRLGTYEALPGLIRLRIHVVLAEGLHLGAAVQHDAMEMIDLEPLTVTQAWQATEVVDGVDGVEHPPSSFLAIGLLYYHRYLTAPRVGGG